MLSSQSHAAPVVLSLGAGGLLGIIGPLSGRIDNPLCHAGNIFLAGGWPWAGLAFLIGYFRRSQGQSAILATAGLTVGVIAYYLAEFLGPMISAAQPPAVPPCSEILVWGTAAFVLGAPLGCLGHMARTPGMSGLAFRVVVPVIAYAEMSERLATETGARETLPTTVWEAVRVASVVAGVALTTHTLWTAATTRHRDQEGSAHD